MATFSSWSALKTQLLNELVSTNLPTQEYILPSGQRRTMRSISEIKKLISLCDVMIQATAGPTGRTVLATF